MKCSKMTKRWDSELAKKILSIRRLYVEQYALRMFEFEVNALRMRRKWMTQSRFITLYVKDIDFFIWNRININ